MTTVPRPLYIGSAGRIRGTLLHGAITWNEPFPTHNGSWGSGQMHGIVLHTEVGHDHNVVTEFNTPSAQASATVSIAFNGSLHQYGPLGKGWACWAQEAGNLTWYAGETEDGGDPNVPMTDAQLWTWAQVLECFATFAGFPLAEANSPSERGLGVHYMGGAAWGQHTCPDLPPHHVRSSQRPVIVDRARLIRGTVSKSWDLPGKDW